MKKSDYEDQLVIADAELEEKLMCKRLWALAEADPKNVEAFEEWNENER